MLETSARLLRLLSLLQSHHDRAGSELAERLGVDVRTVRRDVDRLRELGYPVHAAAGVAGYRLGAGASLPPLLLDDEEAVAVAVGLRGAASGNVAGIEETSVRALAKLEQVLPSHLRHRIGALSSVTVPMRPGGPEVRPEVLTAIAAAARDHHRLRFDYRGNDGATSVREVEPHRLVHTGRRWYLIGYDIGRADWRTYRADRISPRTPTGPRFVPRTPPADLLGHTSRGITTGAYRYQARVTMHTSAERLAERIPPTIGVLEPDGPQRCVLVTGSASLDELALYIGLCGVDFEVHEPDELRERVRELGARLTRAAG
ncbi:DNA-binding transcriptional regulator [Amycolatopsis antarctica]|uniref:DNA-binding transcriptional regulator n=1 Tax=Amycolatopsis antarctica TaxID=1854586 RepID=A0A263DBF7_9PSEU|nr:YafY family protein [Amycolatopsis antarctica]OZM74836.1 DNA-binding transcriptional regulator [Amycolatopsis antarctica]